MHAILGMSMTIISQWNANGEIEKRLIRNTFYF